MSKRFTGTLSVLLQIMTAAILGACGDLDHTAYSQFCDVNGSGWKEADVIIFEPADMDSLASPATRYDIDLVLRGSTRHKPAQFPLCITIEDGNGTISSDTLVIGGVTSHPTRSMLGVREMIIPLSRGTTLTEGYTVSVHPLEAGNTAGLLNVGLTVRK